MKRISQLIQNMIIMVHGHVVFQGNSGSLSESTLWAIPWEAPRNAEQIMAFLHLSLLLSLFLQRLPRQAGAFL